MFVVEQAGGDADHRADVTVDRVADHAVLHQPCGDFFAVPILDPEERETGRQLRTVRSDQFDSWLFQQAILGIGVEFMDARLNVGLAQFQVQLERFVHRPAMFETVITAGGHEGGEIGGFAEGRNDRRDVPDLG
ncbi:hypothetical protein D3C87_1207510 [compost metagenome]